MTVSSNVRGAMCAHEIPPPAAETGSTGRESARTRAIPHQGEGRPPSTTHIDTPRRPSLHVVEALDAATTGWAVSESPPPLTDVLREVVPASGTAGNPLVWVAASAAGGFRLLVTSAAWLLGLAVATRLRAGVGLCLSVVLLVIHLISRAGG